MANVAIFPAMRTVANTANIAKKESVVVAEILNVQFNKEVVFTTDVLNI